MSVGTDYVKTESPRPCTGVSTYHSRWHLHRVTRYITL